MLFSYAADAYNYVMTDVRVHRRYFLFPGLLLLLLAVPGFLLGQQARRGRKYTPPPTTCKLTITVVRSVGGKPLENAAVIFHPLKDGKDDGNMEMKTNQEGKAVLDVIPVGDTVRLQ